MQLSRRNFLIAAPAVIAAGSLMPISALNVPSMSALTDYVPDHVAELDVLYGTLDVRPEWVGSTAYGGALGGGKRNALLTIDMITREAIQLFKNSNVFIEQLDRDYERALAVEGAKIGSELRIRLPQDYDWRKEPVDYSKLATKTPWIKEPSEWRGVNGDDPRYLSDSKERRTIEQVVNDELAITGRSMIRVAHETPDISAPVVAAAAVVGVATIVEKNPVVSRRFWKR